MHSFDAGTFAGKQGRHCIGMPASDPSGETGIMEMAHNATAEKSGAAKYGHAQWHDTKVSPQLRLSRARRYPGRHRHRRDPPITQRDDLGRRDQATAPFIEKGGHRRKPLSDGFDIDHHHNIWYGQTAVNPYLTLSKLDSIICGRALREAGTPRIGLETLLLNRAMIESVILGAAYHETLMAQSRHLRFDPEKLIKIRLA